MKLTDKCRQDFEMWYSVYIKRNKYRYKLIDSTYVDFFYYLPISMQYGVYVDFFLENTSYYVYIKEVPLGKRFSIYIDDLGHHLLTEYIKFDDLDEARDEAIKQANELYNEL